jgi:hypothetical protein
MIVPMDVDHAPLAGLAEDVGRALIRYAGRLRSSAVADQPATRGSGSPAAVSSQAVSVPSSPPAVADQALDPTVPTQLNVKSPGLGVSQKKVLEALRAAGPGGTTANQVAAATGLKSTNTPRMLKTLAERGLISSWGSNPIIWYVEPSGSA